MSVNKIIHVYRKGQKICDIAEIYQKNPYDILIDNKDMHKVFSNDLYKNMSMIQQNVFMFDDTIKENIKLFANYTDEEVLSVCEKSGLSNLISSQES